MATATQTRNQNETLYEETAEKFRDLNERIVDASRKAGTAYIDAYEKGLRSVADYEEKLAEATPVEWVSTALSAQAGFVRDVSRATTTSAREFLK
jgi:hypothetical protein